MESQFSTRSDLFRDGLNVGRDELRPTVERCREHPADFFKAINEQLRLWLAPSKEQKTAQEKVRIGRKYLRRFLQYSPRPLYRSSDDDCFARRARPGTPLASGEI
jgi:hypothetical protein